MGNLLAAAGLPQRPHQLGHGGLGGHVPAVDDAVGQQGARFVDSEADGVIEALANNHHRHPFLAEHVHLVRQIALYKMQPPHAKGLDDNAPVSHFDDVVEYSRIGSGNHL